MTETLTEQPHPTAPEVSNEQFANVLQNTEINIDINTPSIIPPSEIGLADVLDNGEEPNVIDVLSLSEGDQPFSMAVISLKGEDGHSRLVLGGLERNVEGELLLNNKWLSIDDDSGVTFGRNGDVEHGPADIFGAKELWSTNEFDGDVSRSHVTITRNGSTVNIKDTSSNGTFEGVLPARNQTHTAESQDFGHVSTHTLRAEEIAKLQGVMIEQNGEKLFADRPHVTRNTTDPEGMVDIRGWGAGGEAIVVDSLNRPENAEAYQDLYEKMRSKLDGTFTKRDVMNAIFDTVSETMSYDLNFTQQLPEGADPNHRKVNLAYYLGAGKGVCRHMALACQWLGARMTKEYPALFEGGKFTTPVNQRTSDNAAHEWARYTDKNGTVYILDPAQGFVGTLQEAIHDSEQSIRGRWEYSTDANERAIMLDSQLGKDAIGAKIPNKLKKFFGKRG